MHRALHYYCRGDVTGSQICELGLGGVGLGLGCGVYRAFHTGGVVAVTTYPVIIFVGSVWFELDWVDLLWSCLLYTSDAADE